MKSGDIYRFNQNYFWDGEWIQTPTPTKETLPGCDFFEISRSEYLALSSEMPESGSVSKDPAAHMAFHKVLLAREYPHFGVTGIKSLYLILCLQGHYGKKYTKLHRKEGEPLETTLRKLLGGRADCSHASEEFWQACYERIKQKDVSKRISLDEYTQAERDIWRAFVRRASISCNRKK